MKGSLQLDIIIILIIVSTMSQYQYSPLIAHIFSSNESAAFLALTDALKAEIQLVQQNIATNNATAANEHANRALAFLNESVTEEIAERNQRLANDLSTTLTSIKATTESTPSNITSNDINLLVSDAEDIIDEVVSARIELEQLNNSTIQALRMIELLDRLLSSYGNAYAVDFDMTNMSLMMTDNEGMNSILTPNMTDMSMSKERADNMSIGSMSMNNNDSRSATILVDITDYQTAQAIAFKINEVFNSQLAGVFSGAPGGSIDNIASALQELMTKIDGKASPMDIMTTVHTKVHPNLLTAFNLKLR